MKTEMKTKDKAPKLIDTYFKEVDKYIKQFGDKTAVYINVGDFYEIYSAELSNGTTIGNLGKISDMCNLSMSQKKCCVSIDENAKVYMGGFPSYMLDKYVNILVDEYSWTVIVIKQDNQFAGTTRSLEGIYSPGTNLRTTQESNTIVMIVIERVKSRISNTHKTYIGMSSLDCVSGNSVVYETYSEDDNIVLCYDEIQKFISTKNPNEVLIETIEKDITESDLINSLNINNRQTRFNFVKYNKLEKSIDTQIKFFEGIYKYKSKVSIFEYLGLEYKEYARLSLMLLLKYTIDHSRIILEKIDPPEVLEINTQLILANNSLEQLNIIDNKYNPREPSLLNILDMTTTTLGRRNFRNRLLNPIRNPEILNQRYLEIKAFLNTSKPKEKEKETEKEKKMKTKSKSKEKLELHEQPETIEHSRDYYLEIEGILKNIRDLERLHRRMAMNNLMPIEIPSLVNSYISVIELYDAINTRIQNDKSCEILNSFLPSKEIWLEFNEAYKMLDTRFDLDKMGFNTLEKIDKNFFKFGCYEELDNKQNKIDHSIKFFIEFSQWIDNVVSEKDTSKNIKKVAKYDYSEQHQHHIYLTKNRFDVFIKKLKELNNDYHNLDIDGIIYKIDFNNISMENKSRSASNNDVILTFTKDKPKTKAKTKGKINKSIEEEKEEKEDIDLYEYDYDYSLFDKHNHKLRKEMDEMKFIIINAYKETIKEFSTKYLGILKKITNFVGEIDVVKTGAKIAIEKSYNCPEIIPSNTSFISFKAIRHPIIEHINQKVQYIDNDLNLGINNLDGILLFGVNASGKSSLMKAVGINLILAQAGFYVACSEMKYYPFDYLFTRIWNNDNIFKGQSTFEVEISELKSIIKHAGKKSLVLGDELCSGTETISASAIVTAGIKKLSKARAKFIFATHLHFLSDNQHLIELENVKNYHLSVKFNSETGKLIYDRKLKDGSGPSTYGLEICKAMGLEDDFLEEAFKIRDEITNEIVGTFLNNKQSKYNSKIRIENCQICEAKGEDVHHIQFQCNADQNGKIGTIDKNRESNLVVLCKKCHNLVHQNKIKVNGYIETTHGIELDFVKNK